MKLMIVDDEQLIRYGIIKGFDWQSIGIHEMIEATDGEMAVREFLDKKPDVIISDIRMPKMNGIDMAKEILKISNDIKIIILSGYSDFSYAQSAIKLGVFDYVLKPVENEELAKTVVRAMEELNKARENNDRQQQYEKKMESAIPILKQNVLNDLIDKKGYSYQPLPVELKIKDRPAVVVIFKANMTDNSMWKKNEDNGLIVFGLCNVISELFETEPNTEVFEDKSRAVVAICNIDISNGMTGVVQKVEKISEKAHSVLSVSITAAVGGVADGLREIYRSYNEALLLLDSNVGGSTRCLNIMSSKKSVNSEYDNIDNEMNDAVKSFDMEKIKKGAEDFFAFLSASNISIIKAQSFFINIALQIIIRLSKLRNETDMLEYGRKLISDINQTESAEQLRGITERFLETAEKEYKKSKYFGLSSAVRLAVEYIDEHMTEELSLSTIANYVCVSPNHFTTVFKKETGQSVMTYITNIRIEKAKKLFRQRDLKVYEVAEMVGYANPKYFSRVFKEVTGETIYDFRARMM